jgi:hypothetical protein
MGDHMGQRNEIDVYSREYTWRLMAFQSWYREMMDHSTITLMNSEYDYSLLDVKYVLCNIVENTWKHVFWRLVAPSGFLYKVEDDYRVSEKIDRGLFFTEEEAIRDSIIPAIHSRLQETVDNSQRTRGRRVSLEWAWKQEEKSLDIHVHVTDDVAPLLAAAGASVNSEGEHMHALVTQKLVQVLNKTVFLGTARAFYRSREPRDRRTMNGGKRGRMVFQAAFSILAASGITRTSGGDLYSDVDELRDDDTLPDTLQGMTRLVREELRWVRKSRRGTRATVRKKPSALPSIARRFISALEYGDRFKGDLWLLGEFTEAAGLLHDRGCAPALKELDKETAARIARIMGADFDYDKMRAADLITGGSSTRAVALAAVEGLLPTQDTMGYDDYFTLLLSALLASMLDREGESNGMRTVVDAMLNYSGSLNQALSSQTIPLPPTAPIITVGDQELLGPVVAAKALFDRVLLGDMRSVTTMGDIAYHSVYYYLCLCCFTDKELRRFNEHDLNKTAMLAVASAILNHADEQYEGADVETKEPEGAKLSGKRLIVRLVGGRVEVKEALEEGQLVTASAE